MLTADQRKALKANDLLHSSEVDEIPPPICRLWNWFLSGDRLFGGPYADHPKYGTDMRKDAFLRTSQIVWHSLELRLVRTRNTLYKLEGPSA